MGYKMALSFLYFFMNLYFKTFELPVYKLIYPVGYFVTNWFYVQRIKEPKKLSTLFNDILSVRYRRFLKCIVISVVFHMLNSL